MVVSYWRKFVGRVELDFEAPLTLFCTFAVIFSVVGWIVIQLPFKTELFGVELIKHVSDIMTEHEAGKSMFVLSVYTLLVSFIKSVWQARSAVHSFFNRYIVIVPANFLISLVFVEGAVTFSVILVTPTGVPGAGEMFLYLGGKYLVLASTLLSALILLNSDRGFVEGFWLKHGAALCLTALYFLGLLL
ncbi:hypothetical protein [Pseudomonas donghuensis]|uniref:hypothetical protein n=1 Tax=Pseudomonas donghuensis TaxID=1163398 RepID=UPI00029A171B|nr:hypothetical protein [Pseudomonas donghuensis]